MFANKKMKIILHTTLTVLLAIFFMYKGIDKLPVKLKDISKEEIVSTIIDNNSYEAPVGYKITMNTMRQSGFLRMISIFQILAGILMIIPKTRMLGLLILLPIIFNIFFMHVFFDNRMHENIETGILLALNVSLCSYYYNRLKQIIF
jgi:putative oxidoreductase